MPYQPVRNPFPGLGPVPAGGGGFYPRVEALNSVQELLRAGDSVSLVGERKAGKTSFLNYLSRNLSPDEFVPVYVDAQRIMPQRDAVFLSALIRSAAGALADAEEMDQRHAQAQAAAPPGAPIEAFRAALLALFNTHFDLEELKTFCFEIGVDYDNLAGGAVKNNKARELIGFMQRRSLFPELIRSARRLRADVPWPDVPDPLQPARASAPEPAGFRVFDAPPDAVYRAFESDLDALRGRLPADASGRRRRLVWLIDEIETLQGFAQTELFVYLRPLAQSDPDFRFLVAGYDVLYSLAAQSDWSPFYNAFRFQRLTALAPDVARRLVGDALSAMGATAPAAVVNDILHWSGRKPYYLKALLAETAAALNERGRGYGVNRVILERARARFLGQRDVDQIIRHQWDKHTIPRRRVILSLMAARPELDSEAALTAELRARGLPGDWTPQAVLDDLVRLEQLAFFHDEAGRYRFTSECLRQWIVRNKPL